MSLLQNDKWLEHQQEIEEEKQAQYGHLFDADAILVSPVGQELRDVVTIEDLTK
jgi:hypothetical protein